MPGDLHCNRNKYASPYQIAGCRAPEIVKQSDLKDIIQRRRSAAVWQTKDGQGHFSEYVFHEHGQPVGDFRKAWATACCAAGVCKMVCPKCRLDVNDNNKCSECGWTWKREDLRYTGADNVVPDIRPTKRLQCSLAPADQETAFREIAEVFGRVLNHSVCARSQKIPVARCPLPIVAG